MKFENSNSSNLADAGRKLLDHAKEAEFSAKRGAVVELFPYIFAANERLSARAIGRFLEKEQGIKLSPATITKALNDPKKYWNAFFDTIEADALTYQREEKEPMTEFLFKDKMVKDPKSIKLRIAQKLVFSAECQRADNFLREKWFSIDLSIRLKAKPHLEERLTDLATKF